jgi:hypothetical protein
MKAKVKATAVDASILVQAKDKETYFADATDAKALVDRSKIIYNEETGEVTGVKEALADLLKAKPHLAGNGGSPDGSPGSSGGGQRQGGGGAKGGLEEGAEIAKQRNEQRKPKANDGW